MSVGAKILTGFPIISGVSAYPLAVVVKNQQLNVLAETPPPRLDREVTNFSPIEELKQEGHDGCVPVKGRGGYATLYACLKTVGQELQTTFYHYDRYAKAPDKKINQIISINYVSSSKVTMQLKDVGNKPLKLPPFWMGKWPTRQEVKPEDQCKFTKDSSNSGNKITYTLICSGQEVQEGIQF
ncbi:hypothetical protein DNK47_02335 [Mycoplasma wenyonii]|uniref:Uncharacterized protein n=1 Tax=Mycoplasma wenyonii TaxID=65123 RepID=A0A328PV34_9MOLU|nr:hypothetical protein [Mycoplasma wenyonii]RAO94959.1 hypothetical protein DNK47_02335 [Mycoplasma wenyonii]